MFGLCSCTSEHSVPIIDTVRNESNSIHGSQARIASPIAFAGAYDKNIPWWYRIFGRLPNRVEDICQYKNQSAPPSDGKTKRKGKTVWWKRMRRCKVSPTPQEANPNQNRVKCKSEKEEVEKTKVSSAPPKKQTKVKLPSKETRRLQQIRCLGFPNPAQICYMNSCLQSLLTLEDFIADIIQQEQILRLSSDAAILRSLINIQRSHFSGETRVKVRFLSALKKAVACNDPEFIDLHQKDAHEFLTSVLNQIRSLAFNLQDLALSVDLIYSCPVEKNFVFKMYNTRKCMSCGAESVLLEDYTNLSLDLTHGYRTVQELLENYLRDQELKYNCQCGATKSNQHSSFANLPRVLILHLKRFSFTSDLQLLKNHDPVVLSRELVVPLNQGAVCYSLVSTINHIGSTPESGHYICDAVDPEVEPSDVTDRWFTYSDDLVAETHGARVCQQRENSSYILFYKRQDV